MTVEELISKLEREQDKTKSVWIQQSCIEGKQVLVVGDGTKQNQIGDAYEIDLGN